MKPIICVGHAALDFVYRIEAFPPEPTKVRSLEHIESGGGMAANAAATIARLGGRRRAVEPHRRRQRRARASTPSSRPTASTCASCRTYEGARSSTSAVIVDGKGDRLIVGERDHAMSMDACWLPLERVAGAAAVLSDLRWLEGTLAAFEFARAARRADAARCRSRRRAGPLHDFLCLTDYAIFSGPALDAFAPEGEDRERLGRVLEPGRLATQASRAAPQGYYWLSGSGKAGHQPAFASEVVDTTGAGDAFHGAFAWALARRACGARMRARRLQPWRP